MTYQQRAYYERVRRIENGDEAICKCEKCGCFLFFEDLCFRFNEKFYCDSCFHSVVENEFAYRLGFDDIPEPEDEDDMRIKYETRDCINCKHYNPVVHRCTTWECHEERREEN